MVDVAFTLRYLEMLCNDSLAPVEVAAYVRPLAGLVGSEIIAQLYPRDWEWAADKHTKWKLRDYHILMKRVRAAVVRLAVGGGYHLGQRRCNRPVYSAAGSLLRVDAQHQQLDIGWANGIRVYHYHFREGALEYCNPYGDVVSMHLIFSVFWFLLMTVVYKDNDDNMVTVDLDSNEIEILTAGEVDVHADSMMDIRISLSRQCGLWTSEKIETAMECAAALNATRKRKLEDDSSE